MFYTGFTDEAADDIAGQIQALKALGWTSMESRNINGMNLTALNDKDFDKAADQLDEAGIHVCCIGSAIANWAKTITAPPDSSYEELAVAIKRAHRLGTTMVRVMSFNVPVELSLDELFAVEVIKRMKYLAAMAEDGGVVLVHENCNTWGGRSLDHTLRLLDAIQSPHFKLAFDTGNPVFEKDVRGRPPFKYQDALEFYHAVKEHIVHVHIKDGRMAGDTMTFTFPGEGDGHVEEIVNDLLKNRYDGGFSMEPHMAVVAHDSLICSSAEVKFDMFVEYGRRFEALVKTIRTNLKS